MGQSKKRWIIREPSGHITGPFTTEKIIYKIGRGELSGEEMISPYPDGQWKPISRYPQFYDKLLEILAIDEREEPPQETRVLDFTRQETTQESQEPPPESAPLPPPSSPPPPSSAPPKREAKTSTSSRRHTRPPRPRRRRKKPEDIELVDVRPQVLKALVQRAKLPVFLAAAGIVAAVGVLLSSGPEGDRLHLIAPQKGVAQVPAEKLRSRVTQGVSEFLQDTMKGYIRAQNEFVYVVERDNRNGEVMALLCMTYLQLWPYAYQDSRDSKAISILVQMSSQADPAGMNSAACRAVDFIVRARFQEAKSLVEAILDARANEARPPIMFYFLKGFLLEGGGDHASAVGYLQSAQQLWPQWTLPFVLEAQALGKMDKAPQAAKIYRAVLKTNPNHSVARIELGILEYKHFNQLDQAEIYLKQALDSEEAPKPILSRGYFGLAEIALKRGHQSKALIYAQKAFSLNSSNTMAKNLIVQLGGVEKLKKTKIKGQQLLFEGDQFFREGDCHAAQAHYKAAFEEDQKNALAALKAAQCLWKLSFSTEAIAWLNRAIKADPKLIESYVTLADYQAQRYNFLAAARVLESARRVNPKSHEVYRGFALVELRRNNAKGALTFGKRALQLYENDVETLILMSRASLAERDAKMAYNYAAKAVEIDVNHRRAQIAFAEALAGLQGVDVGVDYLLRQVNNYPLVTEYRLALGKMLLADERYQQAEEVFRQITRLEEKPKEAYVELAKVLKAEERQGEALDLLLKAAVLDPADAEPLYLAGVIYLDLRKPQEASVQFQRVLTINKLYPLVNYQLGRAAILMNDPRAALGFTELEKRTNPNLADAYLLAAEAHTLMQQYSLCASEYQRAIKLRPQQAMIYVKLAQCYRKAGTLDAAISMLNVAATKESGLADIYKEQGAIYELKGEMNHAIEAYNQYFVLDPDAADRGQIEARISALQSGQKP